MIDCSIMGILLQQGFGLDLRMEDDLASFREAWRAEVNENQMSIRPLTVPPDSTQESALSAYIAASIHERDGRFHAAILEYRRGKAL